MKIYRGENAWAGRYLEPTFVNRIKLGAGGTHSEVVLGLETLASWAVLHTLSF